MLRSIPISLEALPQLVRMNRYETHMWEEILKWEQANKGTIWDYCTTATTNAIKAALEQTGAYIPTSISDGLHVALEKVLHTCFSGGMNLVNKHKISELAHTRFGIEITDVSQLEELELEQLDELAEAYGSTNQLLALFEGAGMGLGGLFFLAADIPALIMICLRLLIQMAYIYGIDPNVMEEREFLLNIVMLASSDEKERHGLLWKLDQSAKINVQAAMVSAQLEENLVNEVMKRLAGTAHRIAVKLSHTKLLQMLPIIGMAIGAGGNYAFAREITAHGMMILRKRWMMKRYKLFDPVLQYREAKHTQLLTSWVVVNEHTIDDESDIEFEEDFRVQTTSSPNSSAISSVASTSPPTTAPTTSSVSPASTSPTSPFSSWVVENAETAQTPPKRLYPALRPPVPVNHGPVYNGLHNTRPPSNSSPPNNNNYLQNNYSQQSLFAGPPQRPPVPVPYPPQPRN